MSRSRNISKVIGSNSDRSIAEAMAGRSKFASHPDAEIEIVPIWAEGGKLRRWMMIEDPIQRIEQVLKENPLLHGHELKRAAARVFNK